MRQGLRPPCCVPLARLPSHAFPPCHSRPHQLQVPSSEREAASSSCPTCPSCRGSSALRRAVWPSLPLPSVGWGEAGGDSSAPPVSKQGRQLSLVPASGWGSRGSRQPRASWCPDGVQSPPPPRHPVSPADLQTEPLALHSYSPAVQGPSQPRPPPGPGKARSFLRRSPCPSSLWPALPHLPARSRWA